VRSGRLAMVLVATAVAGLGLAACGGSNGASGGLTLYNGQHPETTQALVSAFERETGISVQVRDDDEAVLANQLVAEGANSPADVIYAENSPPLEFLQQHGLLTKVAPATLARVPARYNSPTGHWVGVSARVSVLVYNTDDLKRSELPTSVMQLADPKWRGKLALAPAETDFQPIVTSVERAHGEQAALRWLEGVKANATGHVVASNEALVAMVNSGQAAIGVINQYYWYRARALIGDSGMHSAIAELGPHDVGYVVDVSGAAVLRTSHHRAEAQRFLAFLTSRQGQQIIAAGDSYEYPIASGVTTARSQVPLSELQPNSITVAELGDGSAALSLLQKVQLL
jgi:iron(III) transport system substrate-binding protein